MKQAKLHFSSEEDIISYVNACEAEYRASVQAACDIAEAGGSIITLAGPTCSGKTTTARILDDEFLKRGKALHSISIDDFYFDRDELQRRAKERGEPLDYDSPSTIDLALFGEVIEQIESKGKVLLPKFDFKSGKRAAMEAITVTDGDVFLFEGIQAVYPEVAALFAGVPERSLFINVMQDTVLVDQNGNERVFAPNDIRLLRRLVRDEAKRGATPDFTLFLWRSVRENEERSILPYADGCDYGIDSNMEFDIHILAPHLRRIFAEHPCDGDEVATQNAILASIEGVEGIPDDCLSPTSLYHEFILK